MAKKDLKEYRIWKAMKARCYAPCLKHLSYQQKGIIVCDEWKNSFDKFYEDMGPIPSNKHSLDRINNNGNYEPSNCRWTTTIIQNCNKRFFPSDSGYIGVAISGKRFAASVSICDKKKHIGFFKTALEGALARDLYIIDNNLPNKRNFILKD